MMILRKVLATLSPLQRIFRGRCTSAKLVKAEHRVSCATNFTCVLPEAGDIQQAKEVDAKSHSGL